MKLSNFLNLEMINLNLKASTKDSVLQEMVELFYQAGKISSKEDFYNKILAREAESTTGMGRGIAIPHGKSGEVNELSLALGVSKEGVDFESLDGKPVHIFFMVADLADYSPNYLKLLSKISILVRNSEFREAMLLEDSPKKALSIIQEYE